MRKPKVRAVGCCFYSIKVPSQTTLEYHLCDDPRSRLCSCHTGMEVPMTILHCYPGNKVEGETIMEVGDPFMRTPAKRALIPVKYWRDN